MAVSRDEFVALLTSSQRRLCGFICTLVVDLADAEEVLQETNLTLWQQADRFEPGTDFMAWACRVAHFKVLKWRDARKRQRSHFDEDVIEVLAAWVWREAPDAAANHDLSSARSRDLVAWEGADGHPVALPITLATPGMIVDPVPVGGGILNGTGQVGFDSRQRPALAYFKHDAAGMCSGSIRPRGLFPAVSRSSNRPSPGCGRDSRPTPGRRASPESDSFSAGRRSGPIAISRAQSPGRHRRNCG